MTYEEECVRRELVRSLRAWARQVEDSFVGFPSREPDRDLQMSWGMNLKPPGESPLDHIAVVNAFNEIANDVEDAW